MFKDELNLKSDYAVAKYLDVNRQLMTKINNGHSLSKEMSYRVAGVLKKNPLEIVATSLAEKEKNKELKAMWIKLAKEKGNKETE